MSLGLSVCVSEVNLLSLEHSKHLKLDVSKSFKQVSRKVSSKFQGCFMENVKGVSRVFRGVSR